MKVGIVGAGYVGGVTAVGLAGMGNDVTCVEIDSERLNSWQKGKPPIHEELLESKLQKELSQNRLHFTNNLADAVAGADVIFMAVQTPSADDGSADLSKLLRVAEDIGPLLNKYTVIVNKSTVPTGSAGEVKKKIAIGAKVDFDVVSNPEFLREGHAIKDFEDPDRIVIGTSSKRAQKLMAELYESFVLDGHPIIFTNNEASAELGKYASNGFLALKISFANMIARLCEVTGADVEEVTRIMGTDPRIGPDFLHAGLGWGGSCFPKDTRALLHMAEQANVDANILASSIELNRTQKQILAEKVLNYFDRDIAGKRFALWGLAFKEATDDMRDASSLEIIKLLTSAGAHVIAYDPQAIPNTKRLAEAKNNKLLSFADSQYDALKDADALVIVTLWEQFRNADFGRMKTLLKEPLIFDGRNSYRGERLERISREGFRYESIGRPVVDGRNDRS